jgi:hypothetical protein
MTSLDHLTSAFELLWETKIHLLRTVEGTDSAMQARLNQVLREVATTRDQVEKMLIELQATSPAVPAPPPQ